jgi:hypothetical protein
MLNCVKLHKLTAKHPGLLDAKVVSLVQLDHGVQERELALQVGISTRTVLAYCFVCNVLCLCTALLAAYCAYVQHWPSRVPGKVVHK